MPIPQTIQVNPLDLQKNITIGISLPFTGPKGPFNSTYSTQEQTKFNLINLLLTGKGERVFNPEFGIDLRPLLFENITEDLTPIIQERITSGINIFLPEIIVSEIVVLPDRDRQTISITVKYFLRISGNSDEITVEFI